MKLSEEKIREIITAYSSIKTYSGTAKKVGVSPATVKKYVELNKDCKVEVKNKKERIPFNEKIPSAKEVYVPPFEERGKWLVLSEDELKEIKELRMEE